jgi:arylsulfatase A-like enzyme
VPFIAWGPGFVKGGTISDSLVNLNDVLPTLAAVAGVALPSDYPGDGINLSPVLAGDAELDRSSMFIHYEPRWPSGSPARYAFDRRWKLYQDGGFFDMQADPLEASPLDITALDPDAADAYQSLAAVTESMPGQLQSTRRWLPTVFYLALIGAVFVFVISFWLLRRLVHRFRR